MGAIEDQKDKLVTLESHLCFLRNEKSKIMDCIAKTEEEIFDIRREIERWRIRLPTVSMREFQKRTGLWVVRNYLRDARERIVSNICSSCGGVSKEALKFKLMEPYLVTAGAKPPVCLCGGNYE